MQYVYITRISKKKRNPLSKHLRIESRDSTSPDLEIQIERMKKAANYR